jgi:HSP20 family protein
MLTRFSDYSDWPSFGLADFGRSRTSHRDLMREFERLFGELESGAGQAATSPVSFEDAGESFVFRADVPGLSEADLHINVSGNTLTLRGERKIDVPEGYSAHRRERSPYRFDKSYELPARVDADKASATLKHGVLTLTLPKAAEAQPRQIAVKAA